MVVTSLIIKLSFASQPNFIISEFFSKYHSRTLYKQRVGISLKLFKTHNLTRTGKRTLLILRDLTRNYTVKLPVVNQKLLGLMQ